MSGRLSNRSSDQSGLGRTGQTPSGSMGQCIRNHEPLPLSRPVLPLGLCSPQGLRNSRPKPSTGQSQLRIRFLLLRGVPFNHPIKLRGPLPRSLQRRTRQRLLKPPRLVQGPTPVLLLRRINPIQLSPLEPRVTLGRKKACRCREGWTRIEGGHLQEVSLLII